MRAEKIGRRLFETREIEEEDSTRFPRECSRRTNDANDRFREAVRRASYRYSLSHSPFRLGHELCGITSMLSLIGIPFFRLVVFPFVRSINQHSCNTTWIRTLRSGAIGIPNEEKKRRKGTR